MTRGRPAAHGAGRRLLAGLAAGLALGLAVGETQARVFLRDRHGGEHGAVAAGQPGWSLAYAADLRINEGAGRIEVLGVDAYPREVLAALERAYRDLGLAVFIAGSGDLAWGVAFDAGRAVRFLLLALSPGRECLVFRIDQTREDFFGSLERPREHRLEALPPPPGGRPRFFVADDRADLEVEISDSPRAAGDLARFFASALAADGWTALTPHGGGSSPGPLYARGDRVAAVWIADTPDGARVTRLVKRAR